jgi:fluoride exporter
VTAVVVAGIAVLGGFGAIARFLLDAAVEERVAGQFPAGTFVVNSAGSFALGILTGASLGHHSSLVFATGLLGSFTTFSTWMLESHRLAEEGEAWLAALNVAVGLAAGVGGFLAGRAIGGGL